MSKIIPKGAPLKKGGPHVRSKETRKINVAKGEKDWHWVYNVMIAGLFAGVFSIAYCGKYTLVPILHLSQFVVACLIIGFVVPFKFYRTKLGLGNLEIAMFNVLGVGPILCGLLMWANFLIRTEVHTEVHRVVETTLTTEEFPPQALVSFRLENDTFANFPEHRRFELLMENKDVMQATRVEYKIATGLFGYPVVLDVQYLVDE